MKKVLLILISIFNIGFTKNLNIYVIDQTHLSGINNIKHIIPSNNMEIAIVNGISGTIIYRGRADSVPIRYLMPKRVKKSKVKKIDTPYVIESIYKMLLPIKNLNAKIFFINSIFYKDSRFDFEKGVPNDLFLTSHSSEFNYLNKFINNNRTYIIVSDGYFVNNEHKEGLKRFYYLLFKKLNLNLQSFNSSYNERKENISVKPINESNIVNNSLRIGLTPPKKIHYREDAYKITHDKSRGLVYGYIKNIARKNSTITILLNNEEHLFDCDANGTCKFHINLALGDNTLKFKKINNSEYVHHYISRYIPNDRIKYIVHQIINENEKKDIFELEPEKTYRPAGSKVELEYHEEGKKYYATVDESGYYKFDIPLKYIYNTFVLTEYNGNKSRIEVKSILLQKREEERIKKLREIERKKAEEERRRVEEELRKKGLVKIKAIKNNPEYKGNDGDPRINLKWEGRDDLDLQAIDPCGNRIYFGSKHHSCLGKMGVLDTDENSNRIFNHPQENITWEKGGAVGTYKIRVNLYSNREHKTEVPIILTIVNDGVTYQKRAIVRPKQDFFMQIDHKGSRR